MSKPIEEKLTSVEGLDRMTSRSEEGKSRVVLEFDWDVNKDVARLDVSEKLGLVRNLPDDSDRSTISALNSDSENPIAWVIVETKLPINEVRVEGDAVIRPKLERVEGVGQVWMFGGQDREVRVTLDYAAMSARGITVSALREALRRENKNTKAGRIDEGKRRYAVRTVGNFTRLDQLRNTIVAQNGRGAVYLRDIAKVSFDYGDPTRYIRIRRVPTMGFGVLRKTGANTIEVMAGVKKAIAEINEIYAGRGIRLMQVYDETDYINQSRSLVINNIFVGGALAIGVLLLFLGSPFERDGHRGCHTGHRGLHLHPDLRAGSLHQHHLPGGHGVRRRHGGGQLRRGAGEHLSPPRDGKNQMGRRGGRRAGSLGGRCWLRR